MRLKWSLPLFIVVALALVIFYRLAFTDGILARGDTYVYFYPYWGARDAALAAGHAPLWSSDIFMGVPLLANPQLGTFYPPNWLTIPLNPPDSIRVSILLHEVWAALGVYALARKTLHLSPLAAGLAGALFAFGGYTGAHVEQINQLQGLAWMPWLFLLYHRALKGRLFYYGLLLAAGLALQLFTGHTQTVFITGVGLALYGVGLAAKRPWRITTFLRPLLILVAAGFVALLLAAPQLIPTLELTGLSNRGSGLNPNEATAFSLSPLLLGRGLLPDYDGGLFGEYVAYTGIIGLGLAVVGIGLRRTRRRTLWLALALVGLFLALGMYNPLYASLLAKLPGFSFFRVPARWLALFALGTALLAGMGAQGLFDGQRPGRRTTVAIAVVLGLLALLALVVVPLVAGAGLPDDAFVEGDPVPSTTTVIMWALGLGVLLILLALRRRYLLAGAVLVELFLAANVMPYNDLAPPDVYDGQRFTISQMSVYSDRSARPGRMLAISGLLFDPGDRAVLRERYERAGMDEGAIRHAFVATKRQEMLFPNLGLQWDVPTIDGFGGGLLPTIYYTQFTSLLLPEDTPDAERAVDGRLGERLAQPQCRGACLPASRWLALTNTQYLITDKVYDVWHEGVAYDTTFTYPLASPVSFLLSGFEATGVRLLYTGEQPPAIAGANRGETEMLPDGLHVARYAFEAPVSQRNLTISGAPGTVLHAVTAVDTRTGDFSQLTGPGWERVLSSDIKIYRSNSQLLGRPYVVSEVIVQPDTWAGSEAALDLLRRDDFALNKAIIHGEPPPIPRDQPVAPPRSATVTAYEDTRVTVAVESETPGYLLLTDAYYPGWTATVDDEPAAVYRADVMFRAVRVPAGDSTVEFRYEPWWWPGVLVWGAAVWLLAIGAGIGLRRRAIPGPSR